MRSPHRSLSRVQGWFVVILSLAMPRVASAADGAWVNLNLSTHPGARSEFSAVYDPGRHRMVIFGGADSSDNAVTDVWALDLSGNCTPSWKKLTVTGTAPSYPSDYSAVYDTAFDRMVVFGGEHPGLNDFSNSVTYLKFRANPDSADWVGATPASGPCPRSGHSAYYDGPRHRMLVFAGAYPDAVNLPID